MRNVVAWRRRTHLARGLLSEVIHVIDHRDEQVEEQLAAILHLVLHRPTAFESVSAADDQSEIVGSQLGVGGRRVGVGVAG